MPGRDFAPREIEHLDHEVKFVFPARAATAAHAFLRAHCLPELPHADSLVESIYFDGPKLESLSEKLASDYYKTKIRLRWYDGLEPVWLEVKRRLGSRREKLRRPVPIDGRELSRRRLASPLLDRVNEELASAGLPPPAGLRPALHLTYRRARFHEPSSGLRLALDREIEAREVASWALAFADVRSHLAPRPSPALVEVKGASRDLPPALAGLATLGGRRESFSKYSYCLLA